MSDDFMLWQSFLLRLLWVKMMKRVAVRTCWETPKCQSTRQEMCPKMGPGRPDAFSSILHSPTFLTFALSLP